MLYNGSIENNRFSALLLFINFIIEGHHMKLGVCAKPAQLEHVKSLGYDYAEFNLTSTTKWSDEEFDAAQDALQRTQLRAEAFNGFCPSDLYLSHDVDLDAIKS